MAFPTRGFGITNTGSGSSVVSQPPFTGTSTTPALHVTAITIPDLKVSDVVELE